MTLDSQQTLASNRGALQSCQTLGALFQELQGLTQPSDVPIYLMSNCFLEVLPEMSVNPTVEVLRLCADRGIKCAPRVMEVIPVGNTGSSVVAYQYDGIEQLPTLYSMTEGLKLAPRGDVRERMISQFQSDITAIATLGLIHPHAEGSVKHWRILSGSEPRIVLEDWYSARQGSIKEQSQFVSKMNALLRQATESTAA